MLLLLAALLASAVAQEGLCFTPRNQRTVRLVNCLSQAAWCDFSDCRSGVVNGGASFTGRQAELRPCPSNCAWTAVELEPMIIQEAPAPAPDASTSNGVPQEPTSGFVPPVTNGLPQEPTSGFVPPVTGGFAPADATNVNVNAQPPTGGSVPTDLFVPSSQNNDAVSEGPRVPAPAPAAAPTRRNVDWTGPNDWARVRACAGRSKPGTENLRRVILRFFPTMRNGRTYGCTYMNPTRPASPPYNRGSLSDHADGGAFDAMLPRVGNPVGQQLANALERNWRNLGIKYLIYNRQINTGNGWRRYTGSNPHVDHVHVSLLPKAADGLLESDVVAALQGAPGASASGAAAGASDLPSLGGGSRPNVPSRRATRPATRGRRRS